MTASDRANVFEVALSTRVPLPGADFAEVNLLSDERTVFVE